MAIRLAEIIELEEAREVAFTTLQDRQEVIKRWFDSKTSSDVIFALKDLVLKYNERMAKPGKNTVRHEPQDSWVERTNPQVDDPSKYEVNQLRASLGNAPLDERFEQEWSKVNKSYDETGDSSSHRDSSPKIATQQEVGIINIEGQEPEILLSLDSATHRPHSQSSKRRSEKQSSEAPLRKKPYLSGSEGVEPNTSMTTSTDLQPLQPSTNQFPRLTSQKSQMRPDDYELQAMGVSLQSAIESDKVGMMKETSKAVSTDFIKKSHRSEKLQAENVSRLDKKMNFEAELKAREASLEQSGKCVSELETLLQQEQNHTLQLQQTVRTGEAKILALENQVAIEQNKIQQLQQEMIGKDNEISRLMNLPPPQPMAPDFSTMLTELYVSHWEKVK
ncbi:uncharacterized protein LOC131875997 [Cryptomeria japonica]|uniref:uncharacterized protein LOC131875997 n=1 Tax=Cryptomeria japonica TaxID=3369 RepID=UPI0027DA513A|nr:uncharacterized protein LOC131875997 [Cryptomeria japonica]